MDILAPEIDILAPKMYMLTLKMYILASKMYINQALSGCHSDFTTLWGVWFYFILMVPLRLSV